MLKAKDDLPSQLRFEIEGDAAIEFHAAAEGKTPKLPTFQMTAYTGGEMRIAGWYRPVVLDLRGIKASRHVSILKDHDMSMLVGQATKVDITSEITVAGRITGNDSDEPARTILAHARNGFVWPVSVGVTVKKVEAVGEDVKVKVNGKEFTGPLYVVRSGVLREVSFVGVGADENSESKIAASAVKEKQTMKKFKEWLIANGKDFDTLDEIERFELHATYVAENVKAAADAAASVAAGDKQKDDDSNTDDVIQQRRAEAAAEETRIGGIRKACGDAHGDVCAKAIVEGWSTEKAELEVLRANRSAAPAVHTDTVQPTIKAVEAGMIMQSMAIDDTKLQAQYDEKTLDLADKKFRRLSLKGLMAAACGIDGRPIPSVTADYREWVNAAFSTNTMSSIVSTSANKIMLTSFLQVPSAVLKLFKPVSASNFKTHTGYRMTGGGGFNEVGQDGELKHGDLSDESKTFSVKTYGEILGITRQMIINDDLGMLMELPARFGRDAAIKIESIGWTLVKANTSSFFASGNSNYISGATTVLAIAGLDEATQTLAEMTDSDGNPIATVGKFLVVPPTLSGEAARIYKASNIVATGVGSSKKLDADRNNYEGQYEPVVVPHLSTAIDSTNGSDTAWYLWGNPGYIAPFAIAFLNGVNRPTVEEIAVSGEYLGKAWRGYIDFGVAQWDEEGAVMSKGSA